MKQYNSIGEMLEDLIEAIKKGEVSDIDLEEMVESEKKEVKQKEELPICW